MEIPAPKARLVDRERREVPETREHLDLEANLENRVFQAVTERQASLVTPVLQAQPDHKEDLAPRVRVVCGAELEHQV